MRSGVTSALIEPKGLVYRSSFIEPSEESDFLASIEGLPFRAARTRGAECPTEVRYDTIPPFLLHLRERCTEAAGISFDGFQKALICRYAPGTAGRWHCDPPLPGLVVATVSLGSPARMRLCRSVDSRREKAEVVLEPRSLCLLSGPARCEWRHAIREVEKLRYAISFREVGARRPW